ncbi:glycosyltransferase family 4 protein [Pseudodesulfovibrio indicus]|uniref:glycosyltransferase family 4 protein n=1 Tax=Pseudodesulfovibrio indicus TaxID=1716143 RepID=UPI0029305F32|nr:glycosyltransferase family 4 protein [Pseudodesulfovibrio indicus]
MTSKKRIWGTLDPFYEGGPVLGRTVANSRFLIELLRRDPFDEYHFFLPGKWAADPLRKHLEKTAPALLEQNRVRLLHRHDLAGMLRGVQYHCFHLSDCITCQPFLARMRNQLSAELFPVTGPIHSLSYAHFTRSFLQHLWPGTTRRDAIICTSSAGQRTVEGFFDQLRRGYGLGEDTHPAPRLARIPLGVNVTAYRPCERPGTLPVKILVFGRISHHSKMDLVPLIRALHRLVRDGMDPGSAELILAGWGDKDNQTLETLENLAANTGIKLTTVLRPNEPRKHKLFSEADILVSIADNPQETFGITLVEAGAFGLPVVASDYDGYKDIVVHGETGLLVPTIGSATTPEIDLEAPLTFDSHYHLRLAQATAVEIPALADALGRLIHDPELRRTMGAAARKRVETEYSWPGIIDAHLALWEELWREPADPEPLRDVPHPLTPEYGALFGHYTSRVLEDGTLLKAGRTGQAFYRNKDFPNLYEGIRYAIDLDVVRKLVFFARGAVDSATLIRKVSSIARHLNNTEIENHVLWALKQDILERTE